MITPELYYTSPELLLKSLKDDFTYSFVFEPEFISRLCYDGYLPMADMDNDFDVLLIKLHSQRCIIIPSDIKVGKTVKKKASNYKITINKCFDIVVNQVWVQHGLTWFTPKLYETIKPLIGKIDKISSFHSIELWDDNKLLAGDIGMISGSRYLSMTGFYTLNGSGSILLMSIAKLLNNMGFLLWDLGMEMKYKLDMGAKLINRNDFLNLVLSLRDNKKEFDSDIYFCKDLFKED